MSMALTADHYSVAEDPSWFEILKRRHPPSFQDSSQPISDCQCGHLVTISSVSVSSLRNILAVNVVKDSAERGVKLSSDFLAAAHSEKHYHNVLQVVEQDKKKTPNLKRKRKLNKN